MAILTPVLPYSHHEPRFQDTHGRQVSYLRVSVIDQCNFHCTYCRPEDEFHSPSRHNQLLSFGEIIRIVNLTARFGVKKVRLTGGEPLLRKNLDELVHGLSQITALEDLSLSTNGSLLAPLARSLKEAGLQRVNISLDTLDAGKFRQLTGGDIKTVLNGIRAAQDHDLSPVRLNVVLMRGFNEDEAAALLDFSLRESVELRFIELMPLRSGDHSWSSRYLSIEELLNRPDIRERIDLDAYERISGHTAGTFPYRFHPGKVGFIKPMSQRFCEDCNRIRLMADGKFRPCLPADDEVDLRPILRNGGTDDELVNTIHNAIKAKKAVGEYSFSTIRMPRSMISIGG